MKKTLISILTGTFTVAALAGCTSKINPESQQIKQTNYAQKQVYPQKSEADTKSPSKENDLEHKTSVLNYQLPKYSYGTFKQGLGRNRIDKTGHFREVQTDLLMGFWKGVSDNVPELRKPLCESLLNPEENYKNFSEQEKRDYEKFNPEKYVKKSLWKPLRDKNGKISESDKQVYFIINNNKYLKESFYHIFNSYETYKRLREKEKPN